MINLEMEFLSFDEIDEPKAVEVCERDALKRRLEERSLEEKRLAREGRLERCEANELERSRVCE